MVSIEPASQCVIESEKWYTRPVFSVSSMKESLIFYTEKLGFIQSWKYEEEQKVIVTQVNKGDLEIILTSNLDRVGLGRLFISLDEREFKQLETSIDQNNIESEKIFWGYPTIKIKDPDGNELFFPTESE